MKEGPESFSQEHVSVKQEKQSDREASPGEERAHEEANMMRAWLNRNRDHIPSLVNRVFDFENWNKFIDRKETPEDYDKALKAVEEIEKLAEEEPATAKVLYGVGRALHNAVLPGFAWWFAEQLMLSRQQWVVEKERRQRGDSDYSRITIPDRWLKGVLTDSRKELNQLKKDAGVFLKGELQTAGSRKNKTR